MREYTDYRQYRNDVIAKLNRLTEVYVNAYPECNICDRRGYVQDDFPCDLCGTTRDSRRYRAHAWEVADTIDAQIDAPYVHLDICEVCASLIDSLYVE